MADGQEERDGKPRSGPLVLVACAVIVGAGAVGYFMMRGEKPSEPSSDEPAASAPKRPSNVIDTRDRPARDAGLAEVPAPADRPPAPAPPPSISDLPVIAKRADGREIPPALTSQFSTQVKTVIRECASGIPTEHRAGTRMTGVLTLGITGGSARIDGSKLDLSDVPDGPEKTATLDCLRTKIVGLTQPTTEADITNYEIAVSMFLFPGATGAAKRAAAAGSGSAQPK